jgi:MoaA/NifB/PqqE/SkfB family radical SAM enzyme
MSRIQAVAKELGFDSFQTVKSTKFDGRYQINGVDPLKPTQVSTSALFERDTVFFNRSWINKDYTRNHHPWAKCLNWRKELFISVAGIVYPCAWFNSGYTQNDFVQQHQDRMSIKTRSLDQVLNDDIWQELVNSFDSSTLPICSIKCKNDLG